MQTCVGVLCCTLLKMLVIIVMLLYDLWPLTFWVQIILSQLYYDQQMNQVGWKTARPDFTLPSRQYFSQYSKKNITNIAKVILTGRDFRFLRGQPANDNRTLTTWCISEPEQRQSIFKAQVSTFFLLLTRNLQRSPSILALRSSAEVTDAAAERRRNPVTSDGASRGSESRLRAATVPHRRSDDSKQPPAA